MLTAVTHETIDCRSIFETHYDSHYRPPSPTIQESSYSRITMLPRSYHRSSHLQRSTGSAWFITDEFFFPSLVLLLALRRLFIPFFFRGEGEAKTSKRSKAKPRGKDARHVRWQKPTELEWSVVSFGSRTERIGLSIRNALARCPDQGAPRPRFVSPFLSPSSFCLRSSFLLK